ncbi:MAG: hypothetical protein IPH94_08465 [Saprospiraceae bacterium]|nr:hypothetical protein [Saprospiraceae bacterium]MBK8110796.1 hypothetical protein [Saprospiraceae bacterium]MBK9686426.1 hypothetical protein [Saprospiraceae bacterium]
MKYLKPLNALLLFIAVLISCNKKVEEINAYGNDCVFEQIDDNMDGLIDENERIIMSECLETPLKSKNSIENNLIGDWKLIGHGEGWLPTISQPCGYLTITENELTFQFKNGHIDTVSTHSWKIEEVNNGLNFKLNIIHEYVEGLFINQFCENYMYGDATPSDGNMYLYKKIN